MNPSRIAPLALLLCTGLAQAGTVEVGKAIAEIVAAADGATMVAVSAPRLRPRRRPSRSNPHRRRKAGTTMATDAVKTMAAATGIAAAVTTS